MITAAFAAVFVLYLMGQTQESSSKRQTEEQAHKSRDIAFNSEDYIQEHLQSLDDQEQARWKQLSVSDSTDEQRASFLQRIDQYGLASIYAMRYAEEDNTGPAWNFSGDYAVKAYRESKDSIEEHFFINEAVTSYQNSVEREINEEVQLKLALINIKVLGEIMPGVALLQEIVKQNPNHVQANYELGLLSIQSGQNDKAIDRFTTIINAEPSFIEPYIYKAQLLLKDNNKEEALKTLDQAMKNTDSQEGLKVLQELKKDIINN